MKLDLLYEIEVEKPWPEGQRKAEQQAYWEALEQIERADEAGFNIVWMVEHHFRVERSHCSGPEVFLGAAAMRTKNIRMGHGVVLLPKPFNHPVRVAERAAVLDILSNGRVELATGRSTPYEQDGFDVPFAESREMWEEAIRMLPEIWTQDTFSHEGKYWKVRERAVLPKPVQEPHPALWVAASSDRQLPQGGRERPGGAESVDPRAAGEAGGAHRDLPRRHQAGQAHRKFVNNRLAAYTLVHCAETNAKAIENGGMKACHWWYQHLAEVTLKWEAPIMKAQAEASGDVTAIGGVQARLEDMERQARGEFDVGEYDRQNMVVVGDPDTILRKLESYEEIDVDNLICLMQFGGIKHPDIVKSIELMGQVRDPGAEEAGEEAGGGVGAAVERAMGFEPTTFCLGSKHSTTELRPRERQF